MSDRYAVFGNPIEHSLSPQIHSVFAKSTQQDMHYDKELIDEGLFESKVREFFKNGGRGLNITVPFKLRAFAMADVLSERAQCAGAVNTLYMHEQKLYGDNTDGHGLLADICQYLKWSVAAQRVLILGAGGAARGVILPLLEAQPSELLIVNRTQSKAQELAALFASKKIKTDAGKEPTIINAGCFSELKNAPAFDLIINATSTGLSAEGLNLPENIVHKNTACYDMAYVKDRSDTVFLQWARQHHVTKTADGLGMLLEQAAEAFYVWRAQRPSTITLRQQWQK